MIYSTDITNFPSEKQYIECHSYKDENRFEWKIARVQNGFFVAYFGDSYFKDKYLDLDVNGIQMLITNTGCFFVNDTSFETFYEFREILKNGYTDDIWDSIADLLSERLSHDARLTDSEII